jgi:predicted RecA/RadA family phage recombinase
MKNAFQRGNVVTLVAPYPVRSGDGVQVGGLFGIAASDAPANAAVECELVGAAQINAYPDDVGEIGDAIYWDNSSRWATTSNSGMEIGYLLSPKRPGSTTVLVRLIGAGAGNSFGASSASGTWQVLPTILGLALSTPGFGSSAPDPKKGSPAINYVAGLSYAKGAVRAKGGNIYQATNAAPGVAGASSPPTGTGSGIVDGGVIWKYLRADPDRWLANTVYARGTYVNNADALYYCIQGGTSASSGGPAVNNVNIVDNTCLWNRVTNQFYDCVSGDDTNNGQNHTVPKKTLPLVAGSNIRYLAAAGTGIKLTGSTAQNGIAINGPAIILTVWDRATGNENVAQKNPFTEGCKGNWYTAADLANYFTYEGNSLDVGLYLGTNGQGVVSVMQADPPLVRGWRVKGFGYGGIVAKNGCAMRIEDCIVVDNQRISNPAAPFGGCGIKFEGTSAGLGAPPGTCQVVRCWVSGSGEDEIWAADAPECARAPVFRDTCIRHYGAQQKFNTQHSDGIQLGTYPGDFVCQRVIIEHQLAQNFPLDPTGGSGNYVVGSAFLAVAPAGTVATGGNLTDCILISDTLLFNLQAQAGVALNRVVGYHNYNADTAQSLPPSGGVFAGVAYTETGCRWVTGVLPPGFGVRYAAGGVTINSPAGEFIG